MLPASPETTIAREHSTVCIFWQQGHTSKAAYKGQGAYWAVFWLFSLFSTFLFLLLRLWPGYAFPAWHSGTVEEELTGGVLHLGSGPPKVTHGGYEGWGCMRWDGGGKWVLVPGSMVLVQGGRCHNHQDDIWRSAVGFRWGFWGDGGGVR